MIVRPKGEVKKKATNLLIFINTVSFSIYMPELVPRIRQVELIEQENKLMYGVFRPLEMVERELGMVANAELYYGLLYESIKELGHNMGLIPEKFQGLEDTNHYYWFADHTLIPKKGKFVHIKNIRDTTLTEILSVNFHKLQEEDIQKCLSAYEANLPYNRE